MVGGRAEIPFLAAGAAVLVAAGLMGLSCTAPVTVPADGDTRTQSEQPNILFLFADDQRADTIGAWGNELIDTPNLDRLVAEGWSFRRNYVFPCASRSFSHPR